MMKAYSFSIKYGQG